VKPHLKNEGLTLVVAMKCWPFVLGVEGLRKVVLEFPVGRVEERVVVMK
jgi:hypothetical protein